MLIGFFAPQANSHKLMAPCQFPLMEMDSVAACTFTNRESEDTVTQIEKLFLWVLGVMTCCWLSQEQDNLQPALSI